MAIFKPGLKALDPLVAGGEGQLPKVLSRPGAGAIFVVEEFAA
jgi:hypothetical protein